MAPIHSLKWRSDRKGAIIVSMHLVSVVVQRVQVILLMVELFWLNTVNVLAVEHVWLHAPMMHDIRIRQVMLINAHSVFTGLKTECHLHAWGYVPPNVFILATLMI